MKLPNILITGTPGTGKSLLCEKASEKLGLTWLHLSNIIKEQEFTEGFDSEYNCSILDEDKLLDYLEPLMAKGGNIVEYHSCDFFPERWFQVVYVTRCNNTELYERLEKRGYSKTKLQANVQCEIFQTVLDEALESYSPEIVFELKSESNVDLQNNVRTIETWLEKWKKDHENK